MMRMKRWIPAAALAMLVLASARAAAQQPGDEAAAEVRGVVDGFAAALMAGDTAQAMFYLHPDVVVYEAGTAENREHYRLDHLPSDVAFLAQVRPSDERDQLTVHGDMALYTREYRMRGTYRDRAVNSLGVETLVLLRTSQGWKIRHIHWSSRNAQ